ncbi:MAG: hypothetical protein ABSA77_10305, partial [Thermoguttaceae bacterium]
MSGVSSVSGSSSDAYYYQLLLQLSNELNGQSVGTTSDQSGSLLTNTTSGVDSTILDSTQLNLLEEQIKKAIEQALYAFLTANSNTTSDSSKTSDTTDSTGSTSTSSSTINATDLMTVIKNAVDEVLKENGIDPQQLAPPPPPDADSGANPTSTEASNATSHRRHHRTGGADALLSAGSSSTDSSTSTSSSDSTNVSSATSNQNDQIIKLLQELLANL